MSDPLNINAGAEIRKTVNTVQTAIERQNHFSKQLEPIRVPELRNYQSAEYQFEILMKMIKEFEEELDENHEVAAQLAAFGQSIVMQVTSIGYINPAVIRFYGYVNGQKSQLIQHISQLNFLLMAVQKTDPERPAHRIGFLQHHDGNPEQE